MRLSAASIGPANIASMPGSIDPAPDLGILDIDRGGDLLAHRADVEVELVADPAGGHLRRRPGYGRAACGYCSQSAAAPRRGRACAAIRRRWAVLIAETWCAVQRFCKPRGVHAESWIALMLLADRLGLYRCLRRPGAGAQAVFNPAADYITSGQDEPGYRAWYAANPWRPVYVKALQRLSRHYGRRRRSSRPGSCCAPRPPGSDAARSRSRCRRPPPGRTSSQTLRYIDDYRRSRGRPGRGRLGLSQSGAQRLRRRCARKRPPASWARSTWCRFGRPPARR